MTTYTALTVRPATAADAEMVARLAALDTQRTLTGDVLLAEVEGRAVAAVSLADHRVVADPFARTTHAVAMLRMRAGHLAAGRRGTRRQRLTRLRLREAA